MVALALLFALQTSMSSVRRSQTIRSSGSS